MECDQKPAAVGGLNYRGTLNGFKVGDGSAPIADADIVKTVSARTIILPVC
jgi:hypothetical protein